MKRSKSNSPLTFFSFKFRFKSLCYKVLKSIFTNCYSRILVNRLFTFTLETPSLAAISPSFKDLYLKYAT
ncbi:hypothetical protein BVAVS116_H0042 (plasmid) [Borreliella valaisiana VS116]|uniref:Uncharacterized protein n=1 Tax=Borreliella valaisiana VS116 TaxID=445987 RepID=C0R999_BORVA|nr:hypothetical protein BVAVS116_H0042 [Borreliella valaisiana VS116]